MLSAFPQTIGTGLISPERPSVSKQLNQIKSRAWPIWPWYGPNGKWTAQYSAFLIFRPLKALCTTCHIDPFTHTFILAVTTRKLTFSHTHTHTHIWGSVSHPRTLWNTKLRSQEFNLHPSDWWTTRSTSWADSLSQIFRYWHISFLICTDMKTFFIERLMAKTMLGVIWKWCPHVVCLA